MQGAELETKNSAMTSKCNLNKVIFILAMKFVVFLQGLMQIFHQGFNRNTLSLVIVHSQFIIPNVDKNLEMGIGQAGTDTGDLCTT